MELLAKPINIYNPEQALAQLKEGNFRFLNNFRQHRDPFDDIQKTSEGQAPFAAILTCMDSRVTTEMVFDQGIGDLFVMRIAGNVVNEGILGSLEYAAAVVGSSLLVVMGHTNCGAIKGACDHVKLGNLTGLLNKIRPAIEFAEDVEGPHNSSNPEYVAKVSLSNAKFAAQEILQHSDVIRELVEAGKVKLVAAMYDVSTGKVRFY